MDFNPRTPVGCDDGSVCATCGSRHFNPRTPVGCDRLVEHRQFRNPAYFNPHTPVGCDGKMWARPFRRHHFNPRTPVGCDVKVWQNCPEDERISIHAPQWGATSPIPTGAHCCTDFNPRTPVGCDLPCVRVFRLVVLFQSTHPSGVRPDNQLISDTMIGISIHAPQWGATPLSPQSTAATTHFNPRTPVGCDQARSATVLTP